MVENQSLKYRNMLTKSNSKQRLYLKSPIKNEPDWVTSSHGSVNHRLPKQLGKYQLYLITVTLFKLYCCCLKPNATTTDQYGVEKRNWSRHFACSFELYGPFWSLVGTHHPRPFFEAMGWLDGRLLPIICFRTEQFQLSITGSTILAMKCCGPFYTKNKLINLSLKQKYHLMDQSIKLTELIETVKFHRNPSQTLKFRNCMKSPVLQYFTERNEYQGNTNAPQHIFLNVNLGPYICGRV